MPYLTPSSIPTARISRRLRIPNDPLIIAAVNGAISELSKTWNWQQFEAVTPAEIAVAMDDMYLEYEDSTGMSFVGMIFPYASLTPPTNCLLCDGTTYLKADYPELADVLASTGLDVDATHFKTPDLIHARMIRGTPTLSAVGSNGGSDSITLVTANMPAHTHTYVPAVAAVGAALVGVPIPSAVPGVGATGSAGTGTAFNVTPQHVKTGWMIVAQ